MQHVARWSRSVYVYQESLLSGVPRVLSGQHIPCGQHCTQQVRGLAYGSDKGPKNDKDPTLGEVGSEIVSKIKQLPGAIYQGLTNLANRITGCPQQVPEQPKRQKPTVKSMVSEMFGGGVMGSVMGNTLGRAVDNMTKNVAQQVLAAQEKAAELQQAAEQGIKANHQVNQYLGGNIQLADPISQSSSTQMVNGQQTQTVTLVMPVIGSNGRVAHAHVQLSGPGDLDIKVQLPNGRVIPIDSDPDSDHYDDDLDDGYREKGTQQGRVIDADWREVR